MAMNTKGIKNALLDILQKKKKLISTNSGV